MEGQEYVMEQITTTVIEETSMGIGSMPLSEGDVPTSETGIALTEGGMQAENLAYQDGGNVPVADASIPVGDPSLGESATMDHNAMETKEDGQAKLEDLPVPTTEEERLWQAVRANSADFQSWTSLIQETEKLENIVSVRICYDAFLAEFPLCYGYWKKYADHEARLGTPEKIVEVYERAVRAVTYSVDIWMHYSTYAMEKFEDQDEIRRLFERGLSFVGTDYLSHLLWDKYVEFEYKQQEWSRLMQIYTRILQIPLGQLDRYHASFKQVVVSCPLADLQTSEENAEAVTTASDPPETSVEGQDNPAGDEESKSTGNDELDKYIAVRDAMYKRAKEADAKIRDFESAIRRAYFHVKPLDDIQLGNWHKYLDFMERESDIEKEIKLYERCLIACANYPEYWIRYVQRMEAENNFELANDALHRATEIFVKRRPEIHIFAARFREAGEDVAGARREYELLSTVVAPGLVEAIVKHANFERRQGNIDLACSIFESTIEAEKLKEDSRILPFVYVQYIRFLDQDVKLHEKAQELLAAALEKLPFSKLVLEAAVSFEALHPGEQPFIKLDHAIDQAIRSEVHPGLSFMEREELSSIYLEFLDSHADIHTLKKAEFRHSQLFPSRKSSAESKKRASDGSMSDRAKVQKSYSAAVATASPVPAAQAYSNGQAQWTGAYGAQGYAQQQQNWQAPPQVPQVQAQQWNQGYTQPVTADAAYAGYGSYSAYGPPQQQAAPPQQQAAYGAYAQGYPPQDVNGWSAAGW